MIGTSQTAWMQGTKYGLIMDTLVNDVVTGEIGISTRLAVRPHLVKMDQARREVPKFSSRYLDFNSKRGVSWYAYTRKISHSGVMGDPTKATIEKDQKFWEIMKKIPNWIFAFRILSMVFV